MSHPYGRPSAVELLEAVREFLERDVMSAVEGRVRFHTRVAVNVLAMVGRELAADPAGSTSYTEALAGLGVADEAELAERIRSGELDDRFGEVLAAVKRIVRVRLAVVNPAWIDEP